MKLKLRSRAGFREEGAMQEGHIDLINANRVVGWVAPRDRAEPQILNVSVNGTRLGRRIVADIFRKDLLDAGIGDGRFGFDLRIPSDLCMDVETIVVEVVDAITGNRILEGTWTAPPKLENAILPEPQTYQKVRIDYVSEDYEMFAWAVDTNDKTMVFEIDLLINGEFYKKVYNDRSRGDLRRKNVSGGLGGIQTKLPLEWLGPGVHEVSLRPSHGTACSIEVEVKQACAPRAVLQYCDTQLSTTTVIVPIYNAFEDLKICIERLRRYTPRETPILLIDDASPDPRIEQFLETVCDDPQFRIERNLENLGFTRTINRGFELSGDNDIIMLNSDARVTSNWLPSMLAAARSTPNVATVTAMSDRAGAFSAPDIGNENDLPPSISEEVYARAFRRRQVGRYPEVPTGNGFCMLIRRAALNKFGGLDAEAFPRGYGEENDFCMRALRAGWKNLIDDRTYVFHDRSKSFGETKDANARQGAEVLAGRYPEYKLATRAFHEDEAIRFSRMQARQALKDCTRAESVKPRALFVFSTQSGGTPQTNKDLMGALAQDYDCWALRCSGDVLELSHMADGELESVVIQQLNRPLTPLTHISQEYDEIVEAWLLHYDIELVHIRHLLWHSLNLPHIVRKLGIPSVFSFHDFYTLCPSVNLVKEGVFCGGACTQVGGSCDQVLWPAKMMPKVDFDWIGVWRTRFAEALEACDAFVTTSKAVRDRILTHLPLLPRDRFFVIPHGRNFPFIGNVAAEPQATNAPIRILVPGNIGFNKGSDIIKEIARLDQGERIEFHVLGRMTKAVEQPGIVLHDPYTRDSFLSKVQEIRPHFGAVFTICEETFCHTLTEMWMAGLPVAVFDFPTVGGRVRESGAGWVIDHTDIPTLRTSLIEIGARPEELRTKVDSAIRWRNGPGKGLTTNWMAAQYLDVYRVATTHRAGKLRIDRVVAEASTPRPKIAVVVPQSNVNFTRGNASSHIRVWERTRNELDRDVVYIRMRPDNLMAALHAGRVDGVIIQRNAIPNHWIEEFLETFKKTGVPYVVELDDDLFDVPTDKDPKGRYAAAAQGLERFAKQAAGLITSTESLAGRVRRIHDRVEVAPNLLSRAIWSLPISTRRSDGMIRALYMGSFTHAEDLKMILSAVEGVAMRTPEFRLRLIGVCELPLPEWVERTDPPDSARNYPEFIHFLAEQRSDLDFAIAPLMDSPFNNQKSDLKILEQGALGLPVLASDTQVFSSFASVEGVYLVKNTPSAWQAALEDRIAKIGNCHAEGRALQSWIHAHRELEPSLGAFDRCVVELLNLK